MAAANSEQESVLLQSDEGSPSAPPHPAGRFPFKARLAVGLCLFAAGLAGAVMMGRPAARAPFKIRWSAPTKIWHRWSAIGLSEHEFKHLTKECVDLLEALEKEAEEEGRTHQIDGPSGGTLDCKEDSEQACTFKFSMYGENIDSSKCFPAVCKEENIFKELEANMADVPPEAQLSGLEVSCAAPGSDVDEGTREPWAQYLSEECHDDLVKLEKEAEEEMRQHEGTAEDLDCKESDQTCIVSFTQMGQSFEMAKCFPAACKQQNIFKGLEEVMGGDALSQFSLPPVYQLTGLKISCSGGAEDAKSQAGQCGPEVGLLGASVLAASIFAQ